MDTDDGRRRTEDGGGITEDGKHGFLNEEETNKDRKQGAAKISCFTFHSPKRVLSLSFELTNPGLCVSMRENYTTFTPTV